MGLAISRSIIEFHGGKLWAETEQGSGAKFLFRLPTERKENIMNDVAPIVFLIDDDDMFRRSTERLIRSAGFNMQAFISAGDFLKSPKPQGPACLVLDVRMPGLSGMDLQRELTQIGNRHSNYFYHWPWGYSHVRARNESRRDGVSDQAL